MTSSLPAAGWRRRLVQGLGLALLVVLVASGRSLIGRATTLDRSETCAEVSRLLDAPEFAQLQRRSSGLVLEDRDGRPLPGAPVGAVERRMLTARAVDTARELGGVSAATTDDELASLADSVAYARLVVLGAEPAPVVDPAEPLPPGVDVLLSPERAAELDAAALTVQLGAACRPAGEPPP